MKHRWLGPWRASFDSCTNALPSRSVVRFYNKRGTAEQWIKEGKQATHWVVVKFDGSAG